MPEAAPAPAFSYAFQPIVDVMAREVSAYEALLRSPCGDGAAAVFGSVAAAGLPAFDERIRVFAIDMAVRLGLDRCLNLNVFPRSLVRSAAALDATLAAAARHHLPLERIMLELTEGDMIRDHHRFAELLGEYRGLGLQVSIDDFGAGYSGLNLLAEFQPDQIKIDMNLVRGIEKHGPRQAIVRAISQVCEDLAIDAVAEGVETLPEYRWLAQQGLRLFQGHLFARPGFECLPPATYP